MSDPTALVLTGSFTIALGIFVLFAAVRMAGGRKHPPTDVVSPYQAPLEGIDLPPEPPVGKVAVWFYRPLDLVGAAIVFAMFAVLVTMRTSGGDGAPSFEAGTLLVNLGFQVVMVVAVALPVVLRVGWVSWLGLRWQGWPWVFLIAPGSVVVMWVVFGGLKLSGYMDWMESFGVETVQDTVQLLRKSEDPLVLGLMSVTAVFAAPLCEEIVFRGYFYPVLKRFAGAWPAAVSASLVFGAAHGNLTALLPLFLFGGLLVWVYERTGSLWAPVAVHCCFNSATVIAQMAVRYYHIPLQGSP
jgi:membrane protease YdiL (CAAX protease family)